ncbi:hypothetical protein [uncultured Serinicoccus sp.]|uniref:hypothetical protein n=1 Tax=uncultured Serinicoccus sp. TaxID=735514 RepID=UPI002619B126|nr:hypothetical protein [uncultured Serinicoccus sp.]
MTSAVRRRRPPIDPLVIAFVGAPVWWLLGLFQAMFFVAAAMMVLKLARMRDVLLPRLMAVWLIYLLWVLGGVLTLQVDAPGAVPGESMGRYLTFSYRYVWLVAGAVFLLYIANTPRSLASETIRRALSWFFVVLVGGGLLGLLLPTVDFPSLLEALLPRRVAQIPLAQEIIHPSTAQVQSILGEPQPRPSAPFPYTNEWGMAMAVTLPFFVYTWWRIGPRRRVAMIIILAISAVPIVDSLNRGLWLSLAIVAVFVALRSAFLGSPRTFFVFLALGVVTALVLVTSPLGTTVQERFATPHSDEGRAELSLHTVNSALEGSPVIGFGTTRDVAGNFNSIAGGASVVCPGCEPPPMGTHGQAWFLIFTTGIGGLLLYLTLVGGYFVRHLRSRAPDAGPPLAALLTALVTMPIYNSTGVSLLIVFTSLGLLARLDLAETQREDAPTMVGLLRPLRRGSWLVVAGIAIGVCAGLLVQGVLGAPAVARQSVLVPTANLTGEADVQELTLDSEAELATSHRVLQSVSDVTGRPLPEVEERLTVGAAPNTRVLTLSYDDSDPAVASSAVGTAVTEYLELRADLSNTTQDSLEQRRTARYDSLSGAYTDLQSTLRSTNFVSTTTADALADLRNEMATTDGGLEELTESRELGTRVSDISVTRSNDVLLIRLGSAVVLGTVGGLILAFLWGRYRAGSPRGRVPSEIAGLRTVRVPHEADQGRWDQLYMRRLRSFPSLEVVLPDPTSPTAVEVANYLETRLPRGRRSARRALLLISAQTSLHEITRLLSTCRAMRLRPVGIVHVGSPST